MKKKICVITGSRAEFGILSPLIEKIDQSDQAEMMLLVTGSHLSPEYGMTIKEIEEKYPVVEKVEILLSSDTNVALCKSIGLAMISISETLDRLNPDLVVLLGDRFEIFAAASTAHSMNIPIAHLHGGEITEGAIDDGMRHAITKLSHLHFASTEIYRNRIIQMGENPQTVWNVGALGVENIKNMKLLLKPELEKDLNLSLEANTYLVTYHPETKNSDNTIADFENVLKQLKSLDGMVIFTKANSDPLGRLINQKIESYVSDYNAKMFDNLGALRYLSLLQYVKAVIGNSSSGIIEVPSFNIPTLNIGDRQKGRVCADSVIHCTTKEDDLKKSFNLLKEQVKLNGNFSCQDPYEQKNGSQKILECLLRADLKSALHKKFYDQSPVNN